MTAHRVLVIGADAAGMSAAHQALRAAARVGRDLQVVVLEQTGHTSYSACGLPYWIAGEVASGDDLVARTPQQHRDAGIDLRLHTRAVAVDLGTREVRVEGPDGEQVLEYDDLVLATGAEPVVPEWARRPDGSLLDGVGPVKTLDDGAAWLDRLAETDGDVVIAGGGYIGLEMAEAVLARGRDCALLTRNRVMGRLGVSSGGRVADALRAAGVRVHEHAEVAGLESAHGRVSAVRTAAGGVLPAALVVVALGVRPRTALVRGQVRLGEDGGLRPDRRGWVADGLWAAGDCCEVRHRVSGDWAYLALGTHANKHGRALGDHLGSGGDSPLSFDGALGTEITRFAGGGQYVEVALTGLTEAAAVARGLDVLALTTEGTTASGYLPDAEPVAITVVAERTTRRLLGVQVVGGHGAGKRVDAAAACLWYGGSVDDLAWMDLAYAPPFATAWEFLQVAARRVAERLDRSDPDPLGSDSR